MVHALDLHLVEEDHDAVDIDDTKAPKPVDRLSIARRCGCRACCPEVFRNMT